jgi:hypothetical protein
LVSLELKGLERSITAFQCSVEMIFEESPKQAFESRKLFSGTACDLGGSRRRGLLPSPQDGENVLSDREGHTLMSGRTILAENPALSSREIYGGGILDGIVTEDASRELGADAKKMRKSDFKPEQKTLLLSIRSA